MYSIAASCSSQIAPLGGIVDLYNPQKVKKELKTKKYAKISNTFFHSLKAKYNNDYKNFKSSFEKLPVYTYLNEGIDSGIYDLKKRKITHKNPEKEFKFINLNSLPGLVNENMFVNHLVHPICKTFAKESSEKIEISFKLHRRSIQAGCNEELKGLAPHNDHDADGVAVIKVTQENLHGGENLLVDNERLLVLTDDTIPESGDIVLLYNKCIRHQLNNMKLINSNRPGHRDVVVMDLKQEVLYS